MRDPSLYVDAAVLASLMLLGVLLYQTPLHNPYFCFDDRSAIVYNQAVRSVDLQNIFNAFNTRFLPGLSFAVNYQWCGLDPRGFRLVNVLIHGANAFLVFLLLRSTLSLRKAKKEAAAVWIAVSAALLFLVHPLQTEAVNSITQRFVLMAGFFYLLTLCLFIHYRRSSQKKFLLAGLFSGLAAMLCKEFSVTLGLMLLLYEFYFLEECGGTRAARLRRILPFLALSLIVPLLLWRTPAQAIRQASIADSRAAAASKDITRAKNAIGRKPYFLTELNVVRTYLRLLVLPLNQNFDYDYPITKSLDGKTASSAALCLGLLGAAFFMRRVLPLASFGVFWFFIALSVESSLIPIGHVMAEYRLYLPLVGFVIAAASIGSNLVRHPRAVGMAAAVILLSAGAMTLERNKIWKDEFTLWDDVVRKSPHKARAYNNRGLEYYRRGQIPQAIADFNQTIALDPGFDAAYNNRGVLRGLEGDLNGALADFNKAVALNPEYTDAFNNRRLTLDRLKK